MISNQQYKIIGKNNTSLIVRMTEQLKELALKEGDKIYCCVEEKDGKKRIIVEGVK